MTPAGFAEVTQEVVTVFEHHFARTRRLAELVVALAASGPLTESRLPSLRGEVAGWLTGTDAAVGYGFIAAPDVVEGWQRYLCWFQLGERGVRRLQLNLDPEDVNIYDYLDMDWFSKSRDERRPVVYGPWVDYMGSQQFVLTCTVPVVHDDTFLGIAGADLVVSRLETELIPVLKRIDADVVLVNENRQLVMSNSARWIPGGRLRVHPLRDGTGDFVATAELVSGTGLALAVAPNPSSQGVDI
jgi:hypothetical protein